ncbi:uncharacterized protein LOC124942605 [Impatiens glandulifera]|uniref:uncharacterized protein LOC124942605 n=1 Tax=Impatiens glandulifera TaxID=253017 RepID=UPI001FB16D39|nr:uncharacterized protein LOC124942605 [Impatiens glandulifera]
MVATTRSKRNKLQHLTSGVGWNEERNTSDASNKWLKKSCKLLSKLQKVSHEGLTNEHEELHKKLNSVNIANDQNVGTKGEDIDMELGEEFDASIKSCLEKDMSFGTDIQSSRNKRPLPYSNERNTRKCLDVKLSTGTMTYEFIRVIKVAHVSSTPNVQQVLEMVTAKLGLQSDNPFYDAVALAMRDEQRRMMFNVYESDPLKLHTWLSEMVSRDQMRIAVGNLGTVNGLQ